MSSRLILTQTRAAGPGGPFFAVRDHRDQFQQENEMPEPKGVDIFHAPIETIEEQLSALETKRVRNERLREAQAAASPSARLSVLEQKAKSK